MKSFVIVAGLFWAASSMPIQAASPKALEALCERTATTPRDLARCSTHESTVAVRHLIKAYNDALGRVKDQESSRSFLVTAQKDFLAYRNADCLFFSGEKTDSRSASIYVSCIAELSETRAKELDAWSSSAARTAVSSTAR